MRSYTKADPPSRRVRPIPIQVIVRTLRVAYTATPRMDDLCAIADMTCIGFFYLMRPGEHTLTPTNTPFHVEDAKLYNGAHELNILTASPTQLLAATSCSLTFTTQKNGVKGEVITHGRSGDPWACPVRAVARRLIYHQQHNTELTAPLCQYYDQHGTTRAVRSRDITAAVRMVVALLLNEGDTLDLRPTDVDARSLRAGGATALLCAGIDADTIQLLGRWKSDAMLRYLHIAANPVVHTYASKMFAGGHYSFRPGLLVPVLE